MIKQTLILLFLGILSACHYHLRGSVEVPEVLRNVYVQSASPLLYNSFKDSLQMAGGKLIDKPSPKGVIIRILDEKFDRRSLSLSSTGKASEFELTYNLIFEVLGFDNQVFMPRQQINIRRDYFNDQQDIIGKSNEEVLIRQEMYNQAVRALMDRGRASLNSAHKK